MPEKESITKEEALLKAEIQAFRIELAEIDKRVAALKVERAKPAITLRSAR